MKQPIRPRWPIRPRCPVRPKKPETEILSKEIREVDWDSIQYYDLKTCIHRIFGESNDISWENVSITDIEFDEYHGNTVTLKLDLGKIPNVNYAEEYNIYLKKMDDYNKKYAEYSDKLEKFKKDEKDYKEFVKNEEIREAKKILEKYGVSNG